MKSHVFALAALAAMGFAGTTYAGDATGTWTTSGATAPQVMTDSDMDRITAGAPGEDVGQHWGEGVGGGFSNPNSNSVTHTGAGNGQGGGLLGNNNPDNGRF